MKRIILLVAVAAIMSGCTDSLLSDLAALGTPHHIELYSGGVKVREWVSTGYVEVSSSGGYYFRDSISGRKVSVRGSFAVTALSDSEPNNAGAGDQ